MGCMLCPRRCGADRTTAAGECGTRGITVARAYLHPYEEPPICHTNGAGAVFFGGCSLRCVFCQNYEVSRAERGKELSPSELAALFCRLEEAGADTLDLVTCDHVIPYVAEALKIARPRIPVVFNSGGYVTPSVLSIISPYVDIWLPDLKFFSPELSLRYTGRGDYFEVASNAIRFMAQKPLAWDGERLRSGILVRHLVLPSCTSDSLNVLAFLKGVLPQDAPLSIMRQYTPLGDTKDFPELQRRVTAREYRRVTDYAFQLGFTNLYTQGKESAKESFVPDWDGPSFV